MSGTQSTNLTLPKTLRDNFGKAFHDDILKRVTLEIVAELHLPKGKAMKLATLLNALDGHGLSIVDYNMLADRLADLGVTGDCYVEPASITKAIKTGIVSANDILDSDGLILKPEHYLKDGE